MQLGYLLCRLDFLVLFFGFIFVLRTFDQCTAPETFRKFLLQEQEKHADRASRD